MEKTVNCSCIYGPVHGQMGPKTQTKTRGRTFEALWVVHSHFALKVFVSILANGH